MSSKVVRLASRLLRRAVERTRPPGRMMWTSVSSASKPRPPPTGMPPKPTAPLLPEDVARWLDQFGGEKLIDEMLEEQQAELENPFPPGYAEDLDEEPPAEDRRA